MQHCKVIPTVNDTANATDSFNFKAEITAQTGDYGTKEAGIMVS